MMLTMQWCLSCRKYPKFLLSVWLTEDTVPWPTSLQCVSTDWSDPKHPELLERFLNSIYNKMPVRQVPVKGEIQHSIIKKFNILDQQVKKPTNFVACALESNEKNIFQNLILLQVFRGPACPHLFPGWFLRTELKSSAIPGPSFSGGMQLRFGSRIWAQRLNQIQQRCLVPGGVVLV